MLPKKKKYVKLWEDRDIGHLGAGHDTLLTVEVQDSGQGSRYSTGGTVGKWRPNTGHNTH